MEKLQRYKRNQHKKLQAYLRIMLKFTIDETPYRSGIYSGYNHLKNVINTTKRLPQTQYITNTDVCNID